MIELVLGMATSEYGTIVSAETGFSIINGLGWMNGITSHPTYRQQKTALSQKISDSVDAMPKVISDLISDFATLDLSLAIRIIRLDKAGAPIDDEENKLTIAAQKEVLISPCCDPNLKFKILEHIAGNPQQINVFNKICAGILDSGYKANIDNLNLDRLRLKNLNWSAISSRNVHFDLRFRQQIDQYGFNLGDAIMDDGHYFSDSLLEEYEQFVRATETGQES